MKLRQPIVAGTAMLGCLIAIFAVTDGQRNITSSGGNGVVVVRGALPRDRPPAAIGAASVLPLAPIRDDHDAEIASTIERTYPIVRDVRIACDDRSCEVSITPKPSSSVDEDRVADALLDGGLDRILSSYGYHSTAPIVVDVMGGVNIGFRQSVTRP